VDKVFEVLKLRTVEKLISEISEIYCYITRTSRNFQVTPSQIQKLYVFQNKTMQKSATFKSLVQKMHKWKEKMENIIDWNSKCSVLCLSDFVFLSQSKSFYF